MPKKSTRREVMLGALGATGALSIPSFVFGAPGEEIASPFQGGTNPIVKLPPTIDAKPTNTLRVTIDPSKLDNENDEYNVRVFEFEIKKDASGNFYVVIKYTGIDGIKGGEFHAVVTVKDLSTPMTAKVPLDYIPANKTTKTLVVGVYNNQRSGLGATILCKV